MSRPLPEPWLYHLSLSLLPLSMFRNQCPPVRAFKLVQGWRMHQLHISLPPHLVPGPEVPATAANTSTEQPQGCLLLVSKGSGKGWDLKGPRLRFRVLNQAIPESSQTSTLLFPCLEEQWWSVRSQQSAISSKYGQMKKPSFDLHFAGSSLDVHRVPTWVVWCLNPFFSFSSTYALDLLFSMYDMQWFVISKLFQDSGKKFLLPASFHLSCHAFCCLSWVPGATLLLFLHKKILLLCLSYIQSTWMSIPYWLYYTSIFFLALQLKAK